MNPQFDPQKVSDALEKYEEQRDKTFFEKEIHLGEVLWENSTTLENLHFLCLKLKSDPPFSYNKFFSEELADLSKKFPQSKIDNRTTVVFDFNLDVSKVEMLGMFDSQTFPDNRESIDVYVDAKLVFSGIIYFEITGGREENWVFNKTEFQAFDPGDWIPSLYKQFEVFEELYKQKSEENQEYHTQVQDERIQRKLKEKGIRNNHA